MLIVQTALVLFGTWSSAQALDGFIIECASEHSFIAISGTETKVHLHLEDSLGFSNFPLYNGVVTLPTLPNIRRATEDLKVFDGSMDIEFSRKDCQTDSRKPLLLVCSGHGTVTSPSTLMTSSTLSTTFESNERLDLKYQRLVINLGLDTPIDANYKHYFLDFPFNADNCHGSVVVAK